MGNRIIISKTDDYEIFKIVNSNNELVVLGKYSYKNAKIECLFDSNMNLIVTGCVINIQYNNTKNDVLISVYSIDYSSINSEGGILYSFDNPNIEKIIIQEIKFDELEVVNL